MLAILVLVPVTNMPNVNVLRVLKPFQTFDLFEFSTARDKLDGKSVYNNIKNKIMNSYISDFFFLGATNFQDISPPIKI